MVNCSSCKQPADHFCRCDGSPLCDTDCHQHQGSEHQLFPITAYDRKDLPDYLDRVQLRIDALQGKRGELESFISLVDTCISEFLETISKFETLVQDYKAAHVQKLNELKSSLEAQIAAAVSEAKATLCEDTPQLQHPLTELLREAAMRPVFSYQLRFSEVKRELDRLITYTLSLQPKVEDLVINKGTFVAHIMGSYLTKYQRCELLGEGSYGKVYSVKMKSDPTLVRAVKEVQKATGVETSEQRAALLQEVELLAAVDHPNVMRVYEVFEDDFKFAIVSELITGGELFDFLCSMDVLSEKCAATVISQILGALAHLHEMKIVHRDLKPENIMLETAVEGTKDVHLKLIDFGLSAVLPHNHRLHEITGTLQYMSPEVFSGQYDSKCDIWSAGVILYCMLIGELPFDGETEDQISVSILMNCPNYEHEQWTELSEEALNFVQRLLVSNPANRPTALEALQDPWILQFQQNAENVPIFNLSKLKKYRCDMKLQQAISKFATAQLLSKEETEQARDIFNSFDTNHDGWLSREELIVAMSRKVAAEEAKVEVNQLMSQLDSDGSGRIDYSEFISAWISQEKQLHEDVLDRAFSQIDTDHSGKISVAELEGILGKQGKAQRKVWADMLAQADRNKDGVIDFDEFKKLMIETL